MSAIGGVWRLDGAPRAADTCARILDAQAVYGPHACEQWADVEVAVGRRLYRLLPEDRYDAQPLHGANGVVLVADLRLDNREDLQNALGLDRRAAATMSDSAILLAAWERWEDACFDHLVGVYAFAAWEPAKRRLILARDPMGLRPLHFYRSTGGVAFASMPVGLHAVTAAPAAPDAGYLQSFLALAPEAGGRSFYRDIERVAPGTVVTVDPTRVQTRAHWSPTRRSTAWADQGDAVAAARAHLDMAVGAQLRGLSGTVGAHLSSGWDSTAVTATAARLLAPRGGRVVAFTATPGPGDAGPAPKGRHGDEGRLAAILTANYANIDPVQAVSDGRSPLDDLDVDGAMAGGPGLNPCNQVWLTAINRAARARGVSVVLTGDYGNLSLTYSGEDGLADLADRRQWASWFRHARALVKSGSLRWRGALAITFERRGPEALWAALRRLNGGRPLPPGAHSALRPALWAATARDGLSAGDTSAARRLASLGRFDPGGYHKAALARWGVDLRNPLADLRLIAFCLSVPWETYLADGRPRSLARRALADRVPHDILASPTRGYQAVDWHVGLTTARADLAAELERLERCPPAAALLDLPRLKRLLACWPSTGWQSDAVIADYRLALLRGVAAGRFIRRTLGGNA